jgi:hypothetical protein
VDRAAPAGSTRPSCIPADRRSCGQDRWASLNATVPSVLRRDVLPVRVVLSADRGGRKGRRACRQAYCVAPADRPTRVTDASGRVMSFGAGSPALRLLSNIKDAAFPLDDAETSLTPRRGLSSTPPWFPRSASSAAASPRRRSTSTPPCCPSPPKGCFVWEVARSRLGPRPGDPEPYCLGRTRRGLRPTSTVRESSARPTAHNNAAAASTRSLSRARDSAILRDLLIVKSAVCGRLDMRISALTCIWRPPCHRQIRTSSYSGCYATTVRRPDRTVTWPAEARSATAR